MISSPCRRVVVTGIGAVSSLGCEPDVVAARLRSGWNGVRAMPRWAELGMRSAVGAPVDGFADLCQRSRFTRRQLQSGSDAARYAVLAAEAAVADAGLGAGELAREDTGCLVGCGVGDTESVWRGGDLLYRGSARRVDPFTVLRAMASSPAAHVARLLGIGGRSYGLSSACATSAHAVGHAWELIADGRLEIAVAGGSEELTPLLATAFDAMRGALATRYNDAPERASRPFDRNRDGFVLSEGAGVLVLESREHALARGAGIRGEIAGFAANTDRHDLTLPDPSGEPAAACIRRALRVAGIDPAEVDYVNAHAPGTRAGDPAEARALRRVFGASGPAISSTKSQGGHTIGAAGALEAIHCLLMIAGGFLASCANLEEPDPECEGLDLVRTPREARTRTAVSSSFGFGGTNAVLVLRAPGEGR